ncbi:MAG: GntR family transcriptional regulator [Sphingomonas sp.]
MPVWDGARVDDLASKAGRNVDPFTGAYLALRRDLVSGIAKSGDQIIVVDAAKRLAISPTPVREALARLSGEKLVVDRRGHGYFVPLPSWFDLIELYDLCEMHLLAALSEARRGHHAPVSFDEQAQLGDVGNEAGLDPDGAMLAKVLALSRNARLVAAGSLHIECLASSRRTEHLLYGEAAAQGARLGAFVRAGAWKEAALSVRQSYRSCRRRAEPVAYAMAAAHRARNSANIV